MLLSLRSWLAASVLAGGVAGEALVPIPRAQTAPEAGLRVEHDPPSCFLADKAPRVVACLRPRSARATVRLLFRAQGGAFDYGAALASDTPCYSGVLPRPSRTTPAVVYRIEAKAEAAQAVSPEFVVPVVAEGTACPGSVASTADARGKARTAWEAPAGAPRTPPGFEGTSVSAAPAAAATRPPAAPAAASPPPPRAVAEPRAPSAPAPGAPRAPSSAPVGEARSSGGGHALRNVLIVGAGAAAAGGAVVVAQGAKESGGPNTTTGSGLPPTGASGVYVGTETINYTGGCVGIDDVVLSLQESAGALSGVLTFTVRTCPCCSLGRGANPVTGTLSGTSLGLATPAGFTYSGAFAGNRISGVLAGPGGLSGTWSVDKR